MKSYVPLWICLLAADESNIFRSFFAISHIQLKYEKVLEVYSKVENFNNFKLKYNEAGKNFVAKKNGQSPTGKIVYWCSDVFCRGFDLRPCGEILPP